MSTHIELSKHCLPGLKGHLRTPWRLARGRRFVSLPLRRHAESALPAIDRQPLAPQWSIDIRSRTRVSRNRTCTDTAPSLGSPGTRPIKDQRANWLRVGGAVNSRLIGPPSEYPNNAALSTPVASITVRKSSARFSTVGTPVRRDPTNRSRACRRESPRANDASWPMKVRQSGLSHCRSMWEIQPRHNN